MKKYTGNNWKLYQGSMLDMAEVIQPNSIDSIVTDPPYELNFMGKGWDNSGIAFQADTWKRCFDVLKPGGYLLAFGGSRTFHRIAVAIEDAGFEIRDVIMWLYGSGFPKSLNLGKSVESKLVNGSANTQAFKDLKGTKEEATSLGLVKRNADFGYKSRDYGLDGHERTVEVDYQTDEGQKWDGWGTALKPSYEPIIVARKPCEGSCTDNVLKYGVGGINIDECRVGNETIKGGTMPKMRAGDCFCDFTVGAERLERKGTTGRFPSNTIFTYDETDFEYARYFYCAKASKRDRDEGCDSLEDKMFHRANGGGGLEDDYKFKPVPRKNIHPTVKPTSLMQYLIRLVTPKGGTVLDPFNGSGSTGKAVMYENKDRGAGYKYIGIELTEEYIPISIARISYVMGDEPKEEKPEWEQMTIFDFIKG